MFATGVTMGLAEWIIDDACLVFYSFAENVGQKRTREFAGSMEEPEGLRDRVRSGPGGSLYRPLHLTAVRPGQPCSGLDHRGHGLQDLQERLGRYQQDQRRTSIQGSVIKRVVR